MATEMRILITGGAGYLGTVLVRQLQHIYPLTIVDRFDYGTQPLMSVLSSADAIVIAADLRDSRVVKDALDGVDYVIHLAGIVGYPACDANPQEADETNVGVTDAICDRLDGRGILLASTGSCYGKADGTCDETHDLSPLTRYGRNKRDAEKIVGEVDGLILRFATLYGPSPRMRWDLLIHDFCRKAIKEKALQVYEPHARRTFLHVEDAAYAIRLLATDATGVFNVGTEAGNWTKGDVAKRITDYSGCSLSETSGSDPDGRDYRVDYTKITERLGLDWNGLGRTIGDTIPELLSWAEVWR